jgi:hypothetical protein
MVASHERLSDRGRRGTTGSTTSRWCSASPAPCATARRSPTCPSRCSSLRRALLRDPGGDRVMAQVLSIVPTAGLDAVLVAVELALEGAPLRAVSVEHVLNVIARLNAAPRRRTRPRAAGG